MSKQPEFLTSKPLRFLVFGAGAIGTYIGGSLALAGYQVVFLERPELAVELRQRGLRLKFGEEERLLRAPTVEGSLKDALIHGPFDLGIFAVKAYDTQAALTGLLPFLNDLPTFYCLQNGVENEKAIAAVLGDYRVIAGSVTTAIGRRDAGDIILERFRGIGIGGWSLLSSQLFQAMKLANMNPRFYSDPRSMKWSKMLTNLLANASSAILNMTPVEIFANPKLFKMEIMQLREALAVMDALNVKVVDLPGTPVKMMAWIAKNLPMPAAHLLLAKAVGSGRGAKMPSFYLDLHGGRGKSEVDFLNGAVVRFGQQTGVKTPVNRLLTSTLLAMTEGKLTPANFDHQPDKLFDLEENL
jgi:2-dehydropantoate 2-reductase